MASFVTHVYFFWWCLKKLLLQYMQLSELRSRCLQHSWRHCLHLIEIPCIIWTGFVFFRCQHSVRTYYHQLINHSRLLGINKLERITFFVITIEMVTLIGTKSVILPVSFFSILQTRPHFFNPGGWIVNNIVH